MLGKLETAYGQVIQELETAYDQVVPEPEQLWERAGQRGEIPIKQTEDGRDVKAPVFDGVGVKKLKVDEVRKLRRGRKVVGKVIDYQAVLYDDIERRARVWLPDGYEGTLLGTTGTAFTTTIDGYTADKNRRIATEIGMPRVQVGAEFSGQQFPGVFDALRLADTIEKAPKISIAKSAHAELSIISALAEKHDLPRDIEDDGDSRSSIIALAHAAFAPLHGLRSRYIDPKALVLHDRIEFADFPKVLAWLAKEALVGTGVVGRLGAQGDLLKLRGTASLNPNFVAASLIGIAPALLSGEAGKLAAMMPDDIRGCAVFYQRDMLCDLANWQEGLARYPNLYQHVVPKGVHAHLLGKTATGKQFGRLERLHEENLTHGNNFEAYDMEYIVGHHQSESAHLRPLQIVA